VATRAQRQLGSLAEEGMTPPMVATEALLPAPQTVELQQFLSALR
jgi:hypothetical protein